MTVYPQKNFTRLIQGAKCMMLVSFIGFLATILVTYPYAAYFSISAQITAHILTIVLAGLFKLACVVLMAGMHERGIRQLDN